MVDATTIDGYSEKSYKKTATYKGKRFWFQVHSQEEFENKLRKKKLERDYELGEIDIASPTLADCIIQQDVGDIGESAAIYKFTLAGFTVSKPLTSNAKYDLIVERSGVLHKVQVKCTKSLTESGSASFYLRCHREGRTKTKAYLVSEIDAIFLYCVENGWCGLLLPNGNTFPLTYKVRADGFDELNFDTQINVWKGDVPLFKSE